MISAVVFDFDGLILETEQPIYAAIAELWADHGHELTLTRWAGTIGGGSAEAFDAVAELNRLAGTDHTWDSLSPRIRPRIDALIAGAVVQPGVLDWVEAAEAAGMGIGVASSSSREWVTGHLERLGHAHRFPVVCCSDDVDAHKPDPASYLEACRLLGVEPSEALAVEDSVPGITAARAAGMPAIAVPTAMTAHFDFEEAGAHLVIESLASITLHEAIEAITRRSDPSPGPGPAA